jgi:hypothetical protein
MQNNTIEELLELANSLDWFDLETDEQALVLNLESSVNQIFITRYGLYSTRIFTDAADGYGSQIQADTLDSLHKMILEHYLAPITHLALNEYQ